jgi:hypothetical protein
VKNGEGDEDAEKEDPANPEVADGEALAEVQAVGKAEAGSKEQSPKRHTEKTPRKPQSKPGKGKI